MMNKSLAPTAQNIYTRSLMKFFSKFRKQGVQPSAPVFTDYLNYAVYLHSNGAAVATVSILLYLRYRSVKG